MCVPYSWFDHDLFNFLIAFRISELIYLPLLNSLLLLLDPNPGLKWFPLWLQDLEQIKWWLCHFSSPDDLSHCTPICPHLPSIFLIWSLFPVVINSPCFSHCFSVACFLLLFIPYGFFVSCVLLLVCNSSSSCSLVLMAGGYVKKYFILYVFDPNKVKGIYQSVKYMKSWNRNWQRLLLDHIVFGLPALTCSLGEGCVLVGVVG